MNKKYYLMNKDIKLAEFIITGFGDLETCEDVVIHSPLPFWIKNIDGWISARSAAKHRKHVERILDECGARTLSGFIALTHCLSLGDTLWIKNDKEDVSWEDVSLYHNDFNEVISKLSFDGNGLYGQKMSTTSPELATDGAYDKCWIKNEKGIYLIKAGSSGARNAGLEPYGEVLASQVYREICPNAVDYELANFHRRTVSKCAMFTSEQLGYKPFALYGERQMTFANIVRYFANMGFDDEFARMIIGDCITLNFDRHFGNFGFMVNNDTFEIVSPSRVFDFNMCFTPYAEMPDNFENFDEYLKERGPALGSNYVEPAKVLLTPKTTAELINLKDLELRIQTDDKFTEERLQAINEIKNVQIDRILGRSRVFCFYRENCIER